jgi:hypothetical protein
VIHDHLHRVASFRGKGIGPTHPAADGPRRAAEG